MAVVRRGVGGAPTRWPPINNNTQLSKTRAPCSCLPSPQLGRESAEQVIWTEGEGQQLLVADAFPKRLCFWRNQKKKEEWFFGFSFLSFSGPRIV